VRCLLKKCVPANKHRECKEARVKTIRFEQDGAIGRIVLANPPFNRIDAAYAVNLREAVHEASESEIRVLVIRAEGPNFSFGGEVREWPGKNVHWFRTFVAEVNQSYHAIEALRIPTLASVQGIAMGGGFELALACDLIIAAEDAIFQNIEVTTAMLPIAGAMQRLASHIGRARAIRMAMFGEAVPAQQAFKLGFVTRLVPTERLARETDAVAHQLATGPTLAYGAMRTLLKSWSNGGIAAADSVMLDVTMDLFNSDDVTKGFAAVARALDEDAAPPALTFEGR
jgi:enoyl-CoA hydratase/carnithine racemase